MEEDTELQRLYETYFDDVYHYLLYFTNSKSEAEDLTQDTFIKVFKTYKKFQQKSTIKTWIFSIARHVAIDHYRKKKMLSLVPNLLSNLGKSRDGLPDEHIEKLGNWEILHHALLKVKPDFRNVIILRGLKEFSVKETADILNWKESKVKVDYHRALKELKKIVKQSNESGVILGEEGYR
ncbi:RNA polymerase sigma factor SigX [Bacillus carboniphilus]|uniref:RNA polymerase sigma factor n=1 Tax=Bacillus carboniphilus TaxID=86663 RepID=A0ABN0W9A6_9BACI